MTHRKRPSCVVKLWHCAFKQQAINQMEQVANNPAMMQVATEQMKNMSESDLQQAVGMGVGGGGGTATPQAPSPNGGGGGGNPLDNISADQFRQATMSMDRKSPRLCVCASSSALTRIIENMKRRSSRPTRPR